MATDLEKFVADILKYTGFLLLIPVGKLVDIIVYKQGEYNFWVMMVAIVSFFSAILFFCIGYIIIRRRSFDHES
jgi:Na+/H+ antiporter NhaD/arsenite permease-like protein